jgi:hypothetical protein
MTTSPRRIKEAKMNLFIGQNDVCLIATAIRKVVSLISVNQHLVVLLLRVKQIWLQIWTTLMILKMMTHFDIHQRQMKPMMSSLLCMMNPLLPIFKPLDKGSLTKDAVELLLRTLSETQLARSIPIDIAKNSSFVHSIKTIGHWKNDLCDGMGKWEQTGTGTSNIYIY